MNGAAVNGAMHFQSRVSEGKLSTSFRFFVLSLSLHQFFPVVIQQGYHF